MTDIVYTIAALRDIVRPLLERYDMESASLFGSYARDEADDTSDIDLLLVGREGFKPLTPSRPRRAWPRPR